MSTRPTARTRSARSPDRRQDSGRTDGWSLIYHSGALGDFITTIPAIVCWTRATAGERSVLLTRREHGDLAVKAGVVDEAWDIDEARFSRLFLGDGTPIVDAVPNRTLLFTAVDSPLVEALRNAECRQVTAQPPFPSSPQPIVEYHLSLFRCSAPVFELYEPLRNLGAAQARVLGTAEDLHNAVLLHPGSGGARKSWPAERFEELADVLRNRGDRVIWCLGPAERDFRKPHGDVVLDGPTLPELCGAMTLTRCFVGNDSGIAHLAAACGCPSVVLFGPSDERIWAPCGETVKIVTPAKSTPGDPTRDIRGIEVEQVLSLVNDIRDFSD